MNKKIAALAVAAGTLAASAVVLAQDGNVRLYGRANLGLDSYSATGSTLGAANDFKSRYRVYDAGSRLGVQGTEELGSGLKAIVLMESGVNIDNGGTTGQSGTTNPYTGFLSSRIGHVGLQGGWGQLTFGKSNVWWGNGTIEQTGANYIAAGVPSFNGLLARGMNVGVTRVSNALQYSAAMSGMAVQVSYSPNAEAVQAAANSNNTDGQLWAATVQGQWGPIGAGFDWVKNKGNTPVAVPQAASTGQKLRAGWQYLPGGQISVLWVKSIQDNGGAAAVSASSTQVVTAATLTGLEGAGLVTDAAATSVTQTSWGLSWEHVFGNLQALAQWARVSQITGCVTAAKCANTGATAWTLGARYNLSKRTGVYVNYAVIRNEANYSMDFIGGWMTSASTGVPNVPGLPAGSVGADPRIFGVGVMHNF
jgi:predicted porin